MQKKPRNPSALLSLLLAAVALGAVILGFAVFSPSDGPSATAEIAQTSSATPEPSATPDSTPTGRPVPEVNCTEYSDWLARLDKDLDALDPEASDAQAELDRIQKGLDDLTTAATQAGCLDAVPDMTLPTVKPKPELTTSQANAVDTAADYLDYDAFSKKGLIDQLKYEGFSTADATFGVNHITVDWNEQAVAKAKSYLEYDSFSRSGLIQQLKFEGFTTAQAKHGVDAAGL
jgi:hypothetical protein